VIVSQISPQLTTSSGNDETLWFHEWAKHGTCVSTLTPSCYGPSYKPQEEVVDYFRSAVTVYQALPTYQWLLDAGIVPSTSVTYSRDAIQTALRQRHGADVSLGCKANKFDEVWYHFDVKGSVQTGQFVASIPDGGKTTCPELGIRYPPKRSSGGGGGHSTHVGYPTRTSGPMPTGTGAPFQGKGVLNVITQDDGQRGCIISGGTWYVSGTCAKFTASPLDEEAKQDGKSFTLRSNKGDCAIVKDALICANHVRNPSTFSTNAHGLLSFDGNTTFFADQVPRGWKQVPVYVEPSQHRTSLTIEWSRDW
jgi:ribonuclease T2